MGACRVNIFGATYQTNKTRQCSLFAQSQCSVADRCNFWDHAYELPATNVYVCANVTACISQGSIARRMDMASAELRAARAQLKKAKRAVVVAERQWLLEGDDRATALAIYVLADGDLPPVLKFLHRISKERHWPELCDGALTLLMTELIKHTTDEELLQLTSAGTTLSPEVLRAAHYYAHTWRMRGWANGENNNGTEVATSLVLTHAEEERMKIQENVRPESWGLPYGRAGREFVRRFRQTYEGRIGRLPTRSKDFTISDLREKARAAWQWHNHLVSRVAGGKRVLRINLDETGVCLHQGNKKGNIFLTKSHNVIKRISTGARRTYITHVAVVCDCPVLQAVMPQFVICNERTLPAGSLEAMRERLGDKFVLIRGTSAWVNVDICAQILRSVADALTPYLDALQVIFMLDAHRAHIGIRVWNAANLCRIWLLIIPAGLTWLLQVLDTHGFRSYKQHVYVAHQRSVMRTGIAADRLEPLLDAIKDATRECLCGRSWACAFDGNGFGDDQRSVRRGIKTTLGSMVAESIPATRPSVEQIRICYPRRTRVFYNTIWRSVDGVSPSCVSVAASSSGMLPIAAAASGVCVAAGASSSPTSFSVHPISTRTRAALAKASAAAKSPTAS